MAGILIVTRAARRPAAPDPPGGRGRRRRRARPGRRGPEALGSVSILPARRVVAAARSPGRATATATSTSPASDGRRDDVQRSPWRRGRVRTIDSCLGRSGLERPGGVGRRGPPRHRGRAARRRGRAGRGPRPGGGAGTGGRRRRSASTLRTPHSAGEVAASGRLGTRSLFSFCAFLLSVAGSRPCTTITAVPAFSDGTVGGRADGSRVVVGAATGRGDLDVGAGLRAGVALGRQRGADAAVRRRTLGRADDAVAVLVGRRRRARPWPPMWMCCTCG